MPETKPIDDGGPAFPGTLGTPGYGNSTWTIGPNGDTICVEHNQGLSLRDWFAGNALQGILASETQGDGLVPSAPLSEMLERRAALAAYKFADAMLEARKQPNV